MTMNIIFEKGIPGLDEYKKFELSDVEGNENLKMLIATNDTNVGFITISPFKVKKDYEIELKDEVINELDIEKPEDVLLLNIITLGKSIETSTVNLKAPLVINIKNNKGKQLILQDDKYKIKEPLV